MYTSNMSSQSDEDQQVIVDKIRNYSSLTVTDCSTTKLLVSSSNTITMPTASLNIITTKSNHPISIVPTSSNQSFDETPTTYAELRQTVKNKLPPYTNANASQNSNRMNQNLPKTSAKTITLKKVVSPDKPVAESPLGAPTLLHNKSVTVETRTNMNFNSVPVSRTAQISIVPSKGDKVTLINTTSTISEDLCISQKALQEQIVQFQSNKGSSDILERNIHRKVLSVTPCAVTAKPVSVTKETKAVAVTTITKTVSTSPSAKNFASAKDEMNFSSPTKLVTKSDTNQNVSSNNQPKLTAVNNISKPVLISTSDLLSRNILSKPSSTESNENNISKVKDTASTTSTPDSISRTVDIVSKSIPPKSVPLTISSCISKINPKTTTISVTSCASPSPKKTALPETVQMQTAWSNNRIAMMPDRKELMEALNAGSNINLTESVTISPHQTLQFVVVQQGNDSKIRNINSETTMQPISKQIVGTIPFGYAGNTRGKSGNAEIVGGGNPNPSGSSSNDSSSPSASREQRLRQQESVALIRRSPVQNEEAGIEFRRKTQPEANANPEESVNLYPSRKVEDPVECLTISSDEEEADEPDELNLSYSDASDIGSSLMHKEPSFDAYDEGKMSDADLNVHSKESGSELDATGGSGYTNLNCRSVRIGSYKVTPASPVTVSEYGIRMVVPAINRSSENVILKIPIVEIVKVLIHCGRSLPVLFYYVTPQIAAKVRTVLSMVDSSECYFNPQSKDESQRRITLVLEKFTESSGSAVTELYLNRAILEELNYKEANELLVRSSPKGKRDMMVQKITKQVPSNPVQTIMVYPPPPARGGISINTEDYSCLAEDVFLNDVIIDFYLKWLYNEKLSDEDKQKTHIFSSFFYKRLTDRATPIPRDLHNSRSGDASISSAEIRHSRVTKWTKNIDLFSKDYIIIPLNENQHWFLAIICFPGLSGPVRFSDNKPIDTTSTEIKVESTDNSSNDIDSQTMFIGSTTITPIRQDTTVSVTKFSVVDDDGEADDRDEADGAEEDLNLCLPASEDSEADGSETEATSSRDSKSSGSRCKPEREPIKQPCILIFDSLAGASRARIIATLRDYLRVEYKVKHSDDRDFSKLVVKGACPRVPQQNNYTDCGLFVLQYVESFFENKITDFHIPIRSLRNWFDPDGVGRKRFEIQQLLLRLMINQNIDVDSLNLPRLNLSQHSDDDDDEDDLDDDDEDSTGYRHYDEDDEEFFEDDDDDDELHHSFDYADLADVEDIDEHGVSVVAERALPTRYRQSGSRHVSFAHGNEYMEADDEEEDDGGEAFDAQSNRFGIYDSDFDHEDEEVGRGAGGPNSDADDDLMYEGLDNLEDDVLKAGKRALKCQMASSMRTSRGRGRGGGSACHEGVRRRACDNIIDYDGDEITVRVGSDGVCSQGLEDVRDEDNEEEAGLTVDDVETDDGEESERRQQRLCDLSPELVSLSSAVSVTRRKDGGPNQLAALKAARPFGEVESSDSGGSACKKFRPT